VKLGKSKPFFTRLFENIIIFKEENGILKEILGKLVEEISGGPTSRYFLNQLPVVKLKNHFNFSPILQI